MNQNIETISRETQDRISKLRLKRRNFIKNFKYEDAIKMDEEIDSQRQSSIEESITVILKEFTEIIEPYVHKSYERQMKYEKEKQESIDEHKRKYHFYFQDLQRQQLDALSVIERKLQDNRMRENERTVPEQTNLLELSKKAAMTGDYQKALELRYNSRMIAQKSLIERQAKLDEEFFQQRDELLNSQRSALQTMASKFKQGFEQFDSKLQKKIANNNQNRNNQLISYYQKSLSKLTSLTKSSNIRQHERELQKILFSTLDYYHFEYPQIPTSISQPSLSTTKKSKTAISSSKTQPRLANRRNY